MNPILPHASNGHVPVMLNEVLDALAPVAGGIYVDGTFGSGGYSRAILTAAGCSVWAIDRDPSAVSRGSEMAVAFDGRLTVLLGCFGDMLGLLNQAGIMKVDGVVLDLGVSSMQIDDAARGFSFSENGPLDMRMGTDGETAADIVNRLPERELADLIHHFGEERASRRVARAIVEYRAHTTISSTSQLADIIRRVVRRANDGIDPATRTFQALRIQVNDELGEIDRGLAAAERLLKPEGRLVVVSFHSLEDGRAKAFLRDRTGHGPRPHRHMPEIVEPKLASFYTIIRRPLRPSREEVYANPRARSARLRAAVRLAA
jgi:16S rRNA (cytosine1402-N4)-methyltransferase